MKYSPNVLSSLRAALGAGLLVDPGFLSVPVVVLAAISDFLDGRLARWFGVHKGIGAALDLVADGVFFLGAYAGLWRTGVLPGFWLAAIMVAAIPQLVAQAILWQRSHGVGSVGLWIDKVLGAYSYLFAFALVSGGDPVLFSAGQLALQLAANGADLANVLRAAPAA